MGKPKNTVHITKAEIQRGEKYHVTLDEKSKISQSYSLIASNSAIWDITGNVGLTGDYIPLSGSNQISGDLTPSLPSTYDLGSPENPWKDIYISSGSIHLGDIVLSTDGSNLLVNSGAITGSGGSITGFTDSDIINLSSEVESNSSDITTLTNQIAVNINNISSNFNQISRLIAVTGDYAQDIELQSLSSIVSNNTSTLGNSGNWDSVFSTVTANSSTWDEQFDPTNLSASVNQNNSDIQTVSSQVDINTANILDRTSDIGALSSDVDDMLGQINDNTNRLSGYVNLTTDQNIAGNKRLLNNVRVDGTFTAASAIFITTENLEVSSNFITLNDNVTGTPSENAGVMVNRGSSVKSLLQWNESTNKWQAGISGSLEDITLNDETQALWNDISGVQTDATQALSDASDAQNAADNNTNDINYLSGQITGNTSDIQSISSQVTTNISDISTAQSAADNNTNDINYLSGQITGNTSDINNLSGDWSYGDTVELIFNPSTGYTRVDSTISGHLSGIADALVGASGSGTGGNITGYYDSDIDYLSGQIDNNQTDIQTLSSDISGNTDDINNLSGDWSYGDTVEIVYVPSGYTRDNNTISGHFKGISDNLTFISGEPSGNNYPGVKGQNYYNNSGIMYKCIDTNSWVKWAVTGSW